MATVGILANPASGKDVRRLVARASVFDNQEKQAIVRRALIGIDAVRDIAGEVTVRYFDDSHGIMRRALEEYGKHFVAEPVESAQTTTAFDTITAARAMEDAGCDVVITLGGDGTNRAFCLGWSTATLIPISTGTNNVFPNLQEATIAGTAAALVATGAIDVHAVSYLSKLIRVAVEDERDDLALIDAVLTRERFVGARALLNPESLAAALLTRADPAAVGMTAIGGLLLPVDIREDAGLHLVMGEGGPVIHAPIAPGFYRDVAIARFERVPVGAQVKFTGPGTLAFDGERERTLKAGRHATATLDGNGPRIVDVAHTLRQAAVKGLFRR